MKKYWVDQVLATRNYQAHLAHLFFAYIGCVWLFEPTWRSPGLHCSSIQEKTHPESSAKLCIETCWLKDWNKESMKTCNRFQSFCIKSTSSSVLPEKLGILFHLERGLLSLWEPFGEHSIGLFSLLILLHITILPAGEPLPAVGSWLSWSGVPPPCLGLTGFRLQCRSLSLHD